MKQQKLVSLAFLLVFASTMMLAQCPTSNRQGVHVVQKGETLYRISKRYNISLDNLRTWNNLYSNSITVCQELQVSTTSDGYNSRPSDYNDTSSKGWNDNSNYESSPSYDTNYGTGSYQKQTGSKHVILAGQTVANIARLYGYTEAHFRAFNQLQPNEQPPTGTVLASSDCACARTSVADNSRSTWKDPSKPTPNNTYYSDRVRKDPDDVSDYYTPSTDRNSRANNSNNNSGSSKTLPGVAYLSSEEQEMIDEINLLRSNPAGYIPYVEAYIAEMKAGRTIMRSTDTAYELIEELKRTGPLSTLQPAECIYRAAQKHGQEAVKIGDSDHRGQDGSWPWDRVRRECPNMQDGNENLVGGPDNIRRSMMLLLVDEGIPNRGHRKTLLNPKWRYVACYKSGQVGRMPNSWIQLFGA